MDLNLLAILVIALPLIASLTVGLLSGYLSAKTAQVVTTGAVLCASVFAWIIFYYVGFLGEKIHVKLCKWFEVEGFYADWALYVDVLTALMLVVVTTVSLLVHIYSVGYMAHDKHRQRFMAYLSLFTFFMLMLVTADNFIQLFFGWEGVGLSSYLLIGFWFNRPSANLAAIKAFLVNRVGDIGLALGIFLIFIKFNTLEYQEVFGQVRELVREQMVFLGLEINSVTIICLLLFIGCMGKSAQLALHTWLPDAMEGPTPVSALIHAATMVTAGVFLVARCSPIFEYSECALSVITVVGALTSIFAASIALVQTDIKKIIAYSTCSQLGYMFFACGLSAYSVGVFHLMTHAFFKALLFLGAGSVIHALSDEQDIRKMGGIWKKIPYTYIMMWIGSLALAGIPPFAGFYSKDLILEVAYAKGGKLGQFAYYIGLITAVLTAFYSWRLLIMVFHGKTKVSKVEYAHVHESSTSMLLPLVLLSIGALASGAAGVYLFSMVEASGTFWRGSILVLEKHSVLHHIHDIQGLPLYFPIMAAAGGIFLAYFLYSWFPIILKALSVLMCPVQIFLANKWYFDELYNLIFVRTSICIGKILWKRVDVKLVDGMPNGAAKLAQLSAKVISYIQTGYVYHYVLMIVLSIMILIYWYLPW